MTMDSGIARGALLSALLLCATAGALEAQGLGGKLGRAVKERVGNAATPATTSAAAAPAPPSRGAGFSADQLDRFAAGLTVEVERRRELARELAGLEPRPDYEQCKLGFGMSAAGERALASYMEAVNAYSADPQNPRQQQALEAAQRAYEQAVSKACGPSPDDAPRLRKQRQAEPERAGAERAGLDAFGYGRLKELTLPFCVAADSFTAGSAAQIPSGAGKSYSYSADDTAVLKPRCAQLLPLLQATT